LEVVDCTDLFDLIEDAVVNEVKEVGTVYDLQKISARRQSSQWPSHDQFIFFMVGSE
jgi:hypothetical protein